MSLQNLLTDPALTGTWTLDPQRSSIRFTSKTLWGLIPVNGNAYRVSQQSGTYNFKTPGSGGAGFISPSTLEASTVDLSSEFTGLITTQRAYSASSKIITTADQMLEGLLNIKR